MPKFRPGAPDLVVSPDGKWAAERDGGELRVYNLGQSEPSRSRLGPVETLRQEDRQGRIFFVQNDRIMNLSVDDGGDGGASVVVAELLQIPQLTKIGRSVRIPGTQRILGGGAGGVVVAPTGAGAELVVPRESDLVVYKLFVRGEALSAGHTPDKRILLEQRSGFEVWDAQTRRAMAKLALNTRQAAVQLGFLGDGRMVWALTSTMPMRIEVFRASDGLRFFELERPGRALCVESAPNRLVVGFEEDDTISFLDFDVTSRALRKVPLPPDCKRPLSFVVTPLVRSPEILVRLEESEEPLLRLPLSRIATKEPAARPGTEVRGGSRSETGGPAGKPLGKPDAPVRPSARAMRDARPESRLIRRVLEAESRDPESRAPVPPAAEPAPASPPDIEPEPQTEEPETTDLEGGSEDTETLVVPLVPEIALGGPSQKTPTPAPQPAAQPQPLRAYDAQRSPAAWQWELARWAHGCLSSREAAAPPSAGPLHELSARLQLPPAAQRVLGLLYASATLLGNKPRGMRPVELALALSGQCEEPDVLAEVLPSSALRSLDLLLQKPDGRLLLRREVTLRLGGSPDPAVHWPQTVARELLQAGLYLLDGPCVQKPARLLGRAVLRLDGLSEPAPHKCLPSLMRRALLQDAALVIDGLAGLSFPAFSAPTLLAELWPQLVQPRVPVVLWAMPEAAAAMGLQGRKLTELQIVRDGPAPNYPSSTLPTGVLFRPPSPAAKAAQSPRQTGQLILAQATDRRAALVLGPSANAEAYARAAYLAARDGALLILEAELTPPRVALFAMLLKQIPAVFAATPPGGPDSPWPPELRPFAF